MLGVISRLCFRHSHLAHSHVGDECDAKPAMAFTAKAAGKSSHDAAEKFGAYLGAPIPSVAYRKGNLMTRQRPG